MATLTRARAHISHVLSRECVHVHEQTHARAFIPLWHRQINGSWSWPCRQIWNLECPGCIVDCGQRSEMNRSSGARWARRLAVTYHVVDRNPPPRCSPSPICSPFLPFPSTDRCEALVFVSLPLLSLKRCCKAILDYIVKYMWILLPIDIRYKQKFIHVSCVTAVKIKRVLRLVDIYLDRVNCCKFVTIIVCNKVYTREKRTRIMKHMSNTLNHFKFKVVWISSKN